MMHVCGAWRNDPTDGVVVWTDYWALGILPFKDGFYSSALPQPGGESAGPEKHPDRQALVATLSGAMVGV